VDKADSEEITSAPHHLYHTAIIPSPSTETING
jgi:hypothetical protein